MHLLKEYVANHNEPFELSIGHSNHYIVANVFGGQQNYVILTLNNVIYKPNVVDIGFER